MSTQCVGFDLETTGTDKTDKPVQVCLILRDGTTDRVLVNELVDPRMPIAPGATEVHGITEAMVSEIAPDYVMAAWKLSLLAQALKAGVGPPVLITFNGRNFDVPMIDRCLGAEVFAGFEHVDVLQFARRYFPLVKGNLSKGGKTLADLYLHFLGKPIEHAHNALYDVMATLDLLDAMRKKAGVTLKELVEDQKEYKCFKIMPVGKYIGYAIDDVPISWANFMADKDLDGDLRATVEYILNRGKSR
jgi:DNA polymerase III epsilon subunit-like protein